MSIEAPNSDPGFFGKDGFVPFFGQVESVDDPKRSNRVKIRCPGWHPKSKAQDGEDEDSLKTEDLPWAKVAMPTTMSLQDRTGAKHGLRVGSWVFGFFMDGNDAQDPMVLATFNFTAKTTDNNNREVIDSGEEGVIPEETDAFKKVTDTTRNTGILTKNEEGGSDDPEDISHDTVLDASNNGECIIPESAADEAMKSEKSSGTKGNAEGQKYKVTSADGLCGASKNARDQIDNIMKEMFPPQAARFVFDDQVWNSFTGRYMNLNGIFNKMSQEIAALMRSSIQTEKGNIERIANKLMHSSGILGAATRDEITALTADMSLSTSGDIWHNAFNKMIGGLGEQVLQSLQNINNQQQAPKGQNNTSDTGSTADTEIQNLDTIILTDSIIADVEEKFTLVLENAVNARDEYLEQENKKVIDLKNLIQSTIPEDFECPTDVQNPFIPEEEEEEDDGGSGGGESGSFLDMLTQFDFLKNPKVFNKSGFAEVLDSMTQIGCKAETMFDTSQGMTGSFAGVSGGSSGGGSNSGKSSREDNLYWNIGFGGTPVDETTNPTYVPIDEEALTEKMADAERQRILSKLTSWARVDLHEPGKTYKLEGEQVIDGILSANSRVLVDNQDNSTENGIYITSTGLWKRAEDANTNTHFKKNKYVTIPKPNVEDRYYVYTGINNPRLDNQGITFTRLFYR